MENQISKEYLKGFNNGYVFAKHDPELASALAAMMKGSEKAQGFSDGAKEFLKEKQKGKMPSWLKKDRLSSLNKEHDDKENKDLEKDVS